MGISNERRLGYTLTDWLFNNITVHYDDYYKKTIWHDKSVTILRDGPWHDRYSYSNGLIIIVLGYFITYLLMR